MQLNGEGHAGELWLVETSQLIFESDTDYANKGLNRHARSQRAQHGNNDWI